MVKRRCIDCGIKFDNYYYKRKIRTEHIRFDDVENTDLCKKCRTKLQKKLKKNLKEYYQRPEVKKRIKKYHQKLVDNKRNFKNQILEDYLNHPEKLLNDIKVKDKPKRKKQDMNLSMVF